MTTAAPPVAHAGLDFLGKAALVLLTFQAGGLAHMMVVRGLDGPPNGYLSLVMLAALFAGTQRRLARTQVARGAVAWFTASRAAVFAVLAIASALIVFDGLATPPTRDVTITAIVAAMWAALALKGAAAGRSNRAATWVCASIGRRTAGWAGTERTACSGASCSGAVSSVWRQAS